MIPPIQFAATFQEGATDTLKKFLKTNQNVGDTWRFIDNEVEGLQKKFADDSDKIEISFNTSKGMDSNNFLNKPMLQRRIIPILKLPQEYNYPEGLELEPIDEPIFGPEVNYKIWLEKLTTAINTKITELKEAYK